MNGLKLTKLPDLAEAAKVKALNLSDNLLDDDALVGLARFSALTSLELRKNKISAQGISQLASLQSLTIVDLAGNAITDDGWEALSAPPAIRTLILTKNKVGARGAAALAGLQNLVTLDLDDNAIGDDGIAALANRPTLTKLNISRNGITSIGAAALGRLNRLTSLHLSGNAVGADGIRGLAGLKALARLFLADTQLGAEGGDALRPLSALNRLDITNSGIEDLTFLDALRSLQALTVNGLRIPGANLNQLLATNLQSLYAHQARLGDVPAEMLSKHPTENCLPTLRNYWRDEENKPKIVVPDVKVMILGNGTVGKTQMRRRLAGDAFRENEEPTHGAVVVPAELPAAAGAAPVSLKVWDFGGQDIYLGTHALFIKPDAIYPILWTATNEREPMHKRGEDLFRNYRLTEWIQFVQKLAGKRAPILLVQAQCDKIRERLPSPVSDAQKQAFQFPPIEMRYCAKEDVGNHDLLIANLREAVAWLGPKRIPQSWANVRAELEQLTEQDKKRISRAEFESLCDKHHVGKKQRQTLLQTLDLFGTVFHDQDLFPDLIILNQNWALQAIYSVFDRERTINVNQVLRIDRGRFTRSKLGFLVWNQAGFDVSEQETFIKMMLSCGVAFELQPAAEGREALYVALDLLPGRPDVEDEIAKHFPGGAADAERSFELTFATPRLLRELMRMWGAAPKGAGTSGIYWRDGLCFYDTEAKSRALIEIIQVERSWRAQVSIRCAEGDAAALLDRLTETVVEVASRFGAEVEGELGMASSVTSLEQEVDKPPDPPIVPGPQLIAADRCFISYRRGQDAALNATIARLSNLDIESKYDEKEIRNGESISAFIRESAQAPKFVLLMPPDYFTPEHPFCMEELLHIWEVCSSDKAIFQARVRAVLLDGVALTVQQREQWARQWQERRSNAAKEMIRHLEDHRQTSAISATVDIASRLSSNIGVILAAIADSNYIVGVENISELTFD